MTGLTIAPPAYLGLGRLARIAFNMIFVITEGGELLFLSFSASREKSANDNLFKIR